MPDKPKFRIIIDTNLIVSAMIVAGSRPDHLLQNWKKERYILVTSQELLGEIKETLQKDHLQKKYHLQREKVAQLITLLELAAELATPLSPQELPLHCRDRKDDKLLALALGAAVDYLVTGDKDLLTLNNHPALGKLRIITAKDFLALT